MIITELQDRLDAFCNGYGDVVEGIVALGGNAGIHCVAQWQQSGSTGSPELQLAAQAALRSGSPVVEILQPSLGGARSGTVVAVPIVKGDGSPAGVVAIGLNATNPDSARGTTERLQQLGAALTPTLDELSDAKVSLGANSVLQLQAAVLSRSGFEEGAVVFATRLAELFGLDRACVGLVEDGSARVAAISHGAAVAAREELGRAVAAAMDEAIDQGATICFPAPREGTPRITLAHAELARQQGAAACSIPMVDCGNVVGAVTLERHDGRPLTVDDIARCEHLVSFVGPILALKHENELSWRARIWRWLGATRIRLTGPGEMRFKAAVAAVAVLAVVVFFVPMSYHVSAPARLEGSVQRALAAASDGFIQQVSARPGDAVKEGQVLAELGQQDLQLERSKWQSELAQQVNAYGAALARADRSLLMVNHAKVAEVQAQLDLIERQIERAQIRAPFDGVVISGDLTQSLGAPVQRGAVLLVVAPLDRYRLIVEVDERDIADIRPGSSGELALAALPGKTFPFRTERIAPLAATREGRHFFEVEGRIDSSETLRPGMQGIARIAADDRPLAVRAAERLLGWLRLKLWSWGLWQ